MRNISRLLSFLLVLATLLFSAADIYRNYSRYGIARSNEQSMQRYYRLLEI
jgi:hypothetical protein